jgi:hypothetical protein
MATVICAIDDFQSFVRPTVEPVYFADQEHVARQRRAHTPVSEHNVATVAPLAHTWLWLTGPRRPPGPRLNKLLSAAPSEIPRHAREAP